VDEPARGIGNRSCLATKAASEREDEAGKVGCQIKFVQDDVTGRARKNNCKVLAPPPTAELPMRRVPGEPETWCREWIQSRPHGSLGERTPNEIAEDSHSGEFRKKLPISCSHVAL
jgi:hypothetical protein